MRPEEVRSLSEPQPEILGVRQQATSPMERAQALVTSWEGSMGSSAGVYATIVMSNDVRDRMRDDIVKLLSETITLEHNAT